MVAFQVVVLSCLDLVEVEEELGLVVCSAEVVVPLMEEEVDLEDLVLEVGEVALIGCLAEVAEMMEDLFLDVVVVAQVGLVVLEEEVKAGLHPVV